MQSGPVCTTSDEEIHSWKELAYHCSRLKSIIGLRRPIQFTTFSRLDSQTSDARGSLVVVRMQSSGSWRNTQLPLLVTLSANHYLRCRRSHFSLHRVCYTVTPRCCRPACPVELGCLRCSMYVSFSNPRRNAYQGRG
jgi:hypothetical protein